MRKIIFLFAFCFLFLNSYSQKMKCSVITEVGKIRIELFPENAPATVANFLKYVDSGLYDGKTFYRVCTPENEKEREIKIEVIQGGDVPESRQFEPVKMETTKQAGLRQTNGTL